MYTEENINQQLKQHEKKFYENLKRNDKESLIIKKFLLEGSIPMGQQYVDNWNKACHELGDITEKEFSKKIIKFKGNDPELIKCFEKDYNEDYFSGKIKNNYLYLLTQISEKNNIPINDIRLNISHNNRTGHQKYTHLIYSQDYELHNLNEVLEFMDAELYETSYRHKMIQHKLIIKDKQKEKQLYQDEVIYKKEIQTYDG